MGHLANKSGFKKGLLKQLSKQQDLENNPIIKNQIREECEELKTQIAELKTNYEAVKARIKQLKTTEQESQDCQMK